MHKLPGYRIDELIYEGLRTLVYRAWSERRDRPVVVKLHKDPSPSEQQLASFERAFELGRELRCSGVIPHLALERYRRRLALVTEDFGAVSLGAVLEQELALERRLRIAAALASGLAELHDAGIVHRDVKPNNVVIHPWSDKVKLIDLGISSRLARETPAPAALRQLEGTLAYISPEQTGRMNRSVDFRSDLYSLGVTLYELFTGRLPFTSGDPLELVHCHLARRPPDPCAVSPGLPRPLADVVLKLLAKTAEDRYQSAHGLARDLERCLEAVAGGRPIAPFAPGADDVPTRLSVPQKLYGRERELERLLGCFHAAASGGRELLLVSGYSGVGKSSLVHEVHKPIVARRGTFCSGKFDQFRRDLPYVALIEALRDLMRQVLSEPRERVAAIERDVRQALGPNAAVIADVIPELVHVIGTPPPAVELPPVEAQNRFDGAFQAFLRVFARPEHPLVLFIDDLQWADLPSLHLLEVLITDPDGRHLLVVGAYRDNEVDDDHPLLESVRRIEASGQEVARVRLGPLSEPVLARLVADTFLRPLEEVAELSALVASKTRGNPFFVLEFLHELEQRGLARFEPARGRWVWDLAQVEAAGITDNVVDLMTRKLRELPAPTLEALEVAACIGSAFDLETLSRVLERSKGEAARQLGPALAAGLVVPLDAVYKYVEALSARAESEAGGDTEVNPRYRFLHDRVQQATHALLSEDDRRRRHLEIGRHLLGGRRPDELGDELVDVVNHLDLAVALIRAPEERLELAELNLAAGRRAKASLAIVPAAKYLQVGLDLLPPDAWSTHYRLALALHTELAEVSYLGADFARSEELSRAVLAEARDTLDRVPLAMIRIRAGVAQAEYGRAVEIALAALDELGVRLPRRPNQLAILAAYARFKLALRGRSSESLAALPELEDARVRAAMGILVSCGTSAYYAARNLMALIAFTMFDLALRHGNSPEAAYGYGLTGMVVSGALGDIETGYALGKLAKQVIDGYPESEFHGKVKLFFDGFIRHWKDPLDQPPPALLEDRRAALAQGDLENSVYAGVISLYTAILAGRPLDELADRYEPTIRQMRASKQEQTVPIVECWAQLLVCLRADEPRARLEGELVRADELVEQLQRQENYNALVHAALADGLLALLFGDVEWALWRFGRAERHLDAVIGQAVIPALAYYHALAFAWRAGEVGPAERAALLARQAPLLLKLRRYARLSPENNRHRLAMCVAERDRALGLRGRAEEGYRRAMRGARERGALPDEALAAERLADLYAAGEADDLAEHQIGVAHALYRRWGARAKARALETRWAGLVRAPEEPALGPLTAGSALTRETWHEGDGRAGGLSGLLDLTTVLRASQAISSEIVLDRLLAKLIEIVLANAGAERCVFVGARAGRLFVEAAGAIAGTVEVPREEPLEGTDRCSSAVVEYVARTRRQVLIDDAREELRFSGCGYLAQRRPRAVLCAPVVKQTQLVGVLYLENNVTPGAFTPDRLQTLEVLASEVATAVENARLYEQLREKNDALQLALARVELLERAKHHLSKFVPRLVQERIEQNPAEPGLERAERDVSVLFLDIAGYTRMSEAVDPGRLSLLLERYFSAFLDDIHRNQGDINETAGDGLMILFQEGGEDHALRAVRTALAIRDKTRQVNAALAGEVEPIVVNMGIGSGAALVGSVRFVGVTGTRWTYTATGQVTNLAARVAAHASEGAVLVTEATARRVGEAVPLEPLGALQFKNVSEPTEVYRLAAG